MKRQFFLFLILTNMVSIHSIGQHQKETTGDLGVLSIKNNSAVKVNSYQTISFVYKAGNLGIKKEGGLRICLTHMNQDWSPFQDTNAVMDGYLTVVRSSGNVLPIKTHSGFKNNFLMNDYFPLQNIIEITFTDDKLLPYDSIFITLGNRTGGSKGWLIQPFDEKEFRFVAFVDIYASGSFNLLPSYPVLEIKPEAAYRLRVVNPSDAIKDIPTYCVVTVEDIHGNPAIGFKGSVKLETSDTLSNLPLMYTFTPNDSATHKFDSIIFKNTGFYWFTAISDTMNTSGNPIRVTNSKIERMKYWGDIHGHTILSDGRGSVEDYYRFARDYAALDFCAVTDHDFEISDSMWEHSKKVTNYFNQENRFVTFNAFEWSGEKKLGGDHNVYWLDDDPPLYRCVLFYSSKNIQTVHDTSSSINHISLLYKKLETHYTNKNIIVIPHKGGRSANNTWSHPVLERLIETYCEHNRSVEWSSQFLDKGFKLGMMASSDDHYGNPGYGYLYAWNKKIGEGLTAVNSYSLTRKDLFHSLYDRNCYATTGDRIWLEFSINGFHMGSELKDISHANISVITAGTCTIDYVEIRKNNRVINTISVGKRSIEILFNDREYKKEESCFYNIRVVQENNEEAISSPIWIN